MCKCISNIIRKFHKQLIEQNPASNLSDDTGEAIFNHICYVLPSLYDNNIFKATSFEHLGKLYFDNILTSVDNATNDIIQDVIQAMSTTGSKLSQENEYWSALTDIVHIKSLPREAYKKIKKEYDTVYLPKYRTAQKKYRAKIDSLASEISLLENERESIKKRIKEKRAVTYDITSDEERYRIVCSEHNRATTRKVQLEFAFTSISKKLDQFCRIDDSADQVEICLRKKAIDIAFHGTKVDTLFLPYISFLSILESDIDDDRYVMNQVKRLALIDIYREKQHNAIYITDKNAREHTINEHTVAMASIPSSDVLSAAYTKGIDDYLSELDQLIDKFDIISLIKEDIANSVALQTRADLLYDVLKLYIDGNYALFNCTAPIQVEGMFADFLYAANTFQRFTDLDLFERDVLNIKLQKLTECSEVDLEVVEYFQYHFTNLIRNRAAHGRYIKASDPRNDELLAKELLLDMKCLTHQIRRKAEVEKMLRCVKGYIDYCNMLDTSSTDTIYRAIYGDFTGRRMHLTYDSLDQINPIQFLYWIINPYYEKIFQTMSLDNEVKRIRGHLYSKDFWQFAHKKIQEDLSLGKKFDSDVISAVKCMFKCPIDSESKRWIGKIHNILNNL